MNVRCVGAVHSSTLPDGSPGGVASGYLMECCGTCVYHAGDTALSTEFELVGRLWTPDVAILPIGGTFTMGYADVPAAMDTSSHEPAMVALATRCGVGPRNSATQVMACDPFVGGA